MNIIDQLNEQVAQNRASIRALARACGATVAEMDEDMRQPDPDPDPDLVEFPVGTVTHCNLCQTLSPLLEPVKGRRVGRAYRLEVSMLCCGHYDAHWVHPGDQEEAR